MSTVPSDTSLQSKIEGRTKSFGLELLVSGMMLGIVLPGIVPGMMPGIVPGNSDYRYQ